MKEVTNSPLFNLVDNASLSSRSLVRKSSFLKLSAADKKTFVSFLKKLSQVVHEKSKGTSDVEPNTQSKVSTHADSSDQENSAQSKVSVDPSSHDSSQVIKDSGTSDKDQHEASNVDNAKKDSDALVLAQSQTPIDDSQATVESSAQATQVALASVIQDSILEIISRMQVSPEMVNRVQTSNKNDLASQVALFMDVLKEVSQNTKNMSATLEGLGQSSQAQDVPQILADVFAKLANSVSNELQSISKNESDQKLSQSSDSSDKTVFTDDKTVLTDILNKIEGLSVTKSALPKEITGKQNHTLSLSPKVATQEENADPAKVVEPFDGMKTDSETVFSKVQDDSIKNIALSSDQALGNDDTTQIASDNNVASIATAGSSLTHTTHEASSTNQPLRVEPKTFVHEIVQDIHTTITKNIQEATIQLKPEFLGKAVLSLRMADNHVTLRIEVNNNSAKDALEVNLASLKDTLREKGLTIDNVQVSLNSSEKDAYLAQQQHQQPWQSHSSQNASPSSAPVSEDDMFELANAAGEHSGQKTQDVSDNNINYLI